MKANESLYQGFAKLMWTYVGHVTSYQQFVVKQTLLASTFAQETACSKGKPCTEDRMWLVSDVKFYIPQIKL
jgi:hypothetical protein